MMAVVDDDGGFLKTKSIQFYLGGRGAGAQPHWHACAWNMLLHGAKQWVLSPPERASYAQSHVSLALQQNTSKKGSLSCTQRAGDILVVPETWGHATVNSEPSIGWATELQFDRTFDLGLGASHGTEWWRTQDSPPARGQQMKKARAESHDADGSDAGRGDRQGSLSVDSAPVPGKRKKRRRHATRTPRSHIKSEL